MTSFTNDLILGCIKVSPALRLNHNYKKSSLRSEAAVANICKSQLARVSKYHRIKNLCNVNETPANDSANCLSSTQKNVHLNIVSQQEK